MNDFDLKKYLVENKLTRNSRLLKEEDYNEDPELERIEMFVKNKIGSMSPEEFTNFVKQIGDYEDWTGAPEPIDPFNNIDDRIETIGQNFEEDEYKKYYNALINHG
jgi:hypothetical protein